MWIGWNQENCIQNKLKNWMCVDIRDAGVWTRFCGHSPDWRVVENFHLPNLKTTGDQQEEESVRGKKHSPSWRVGFYFYSPIINSTCIILASGYPHPW
jgi:hypothetical protein